MSGFQKLDLKIDIERLKEEFQTLKHLIDDRNQVAINCRFGETDGLYGHLARPRTIEEFCPVINLPFRETYLAEVLGMIPFAFGQARIMRLKPRTCYSYHSDTSYRFHLVLETNEACMMYLENEVPVHMPADGYFYRVNTMRNHLAFNAGNADRFHLVVVDLSGEQSFLT